MCTRQHCKSCKVCALPMRVDLNSMLETRMLRINLFVFALSRHVLLRFHSGGRVFGLRRAGSSHLTPLRTSPDLTIVQNWLWKSNESRGNSWGIMGGPTDTHRVTYNVLPRGCSGMEATLVLRCPHDSFHRNSCNCGAVLVETSWGNLRSMATSKRCRLDKRRHMGAHTLPRNLLKPPRRQSSGAHIPNTE